MRALLSTRFAVVLGLLGTGCGAIEGGENSLAACMPGSGDEDGDDLVDCEDPDCYSFELCRQSSRLDAPDSGAGGTANAGTGGNSAGGSSGTSGGAGGNNPTGMTDASVDSGGPIEQLPPDSGGIPDAAVVPCGGCAVGEECIEEACVPTAGTTGGTYTLTVLSGTMPLATSPGYMCVDYKCLGGGAPAFWCPCAPDPYVRVIRIHNESETELLVTGVVLAEVNPVFDPIPAVVDLEPGDSLRFEMWDKNESIVDKQVFTCKPDLSSLDPGPLECTARSGGFGNETHVIRAELGAGPD